MITCPVLSYGFSHHLFHQAAALVNRVPGYRVATSSYVSPQLVSRLRPWLPRLAQNLGRRSHTGVPAKVVRTYPIEHLYQLVARLARRPYSYFAAHDRMARRIGYDFAPPGVLIAIDTGAEALFRRWKGKTKCVLDLTIAVPHFRSRIFAAAEASSAHAGVCFHHPGEWELTRYAAEVAMADLILCPSEFVMESCRYLGAPAEKLRLLPYGFDPGRFTAPSRPRPLTTPLQIVFAGTFNHRKGSHVLLTAFAKLRAVYPGATLHIFGEVQDQPGSATDGVRFYGRVSQPELAARFHEMDIMAFPTLFEGSAYVVYQALASGVPVITTKNCGSVVGPSCGEILPEISAQALYEALARYATDRAALARLAVAAPEHIRRYTWDQYGQRLHNLLREAFPSILP